MKFASIGECMIEISVLPNGAVLKSFGGDTLNTAVYLARLGQPVEYVTALGEDPYSLEMCSAWKAEGVGIELVSCLSNRVPGLYMINTDAHGERSFHYWRDQAPAREVLDGDAGLELARRLCDFDALYFSGITLSILSVEGRARLKDVAKTIRAKGGKVLFDGNYRPRGWPDAAAARAVFSEFIPTMTHALPTLDDEQAMRDDSNLDAETVVNYYLAGGLDEVVVKQGPQGAMFATPDRRGLVPILEEITPIDTTAAGDSFNAGFIHARFSGADLAEAVTCGHRLAAAVITQRGAIIPPSAMPNNRKQNK